MAGGRPKKPFKDEYCDMLIEHMRQGLSFESFGALVPAGKQLLYSWLEEHPQFSHAKNIGEAHSRIFWENLGLSGIRGEIQGFSAAVYIFNMKNRFLWRDQVNIETKSTVKIEHSVEKVKDLPVDEISREYFNLISQKAH